METAVRVLLIGPPGSRHAALRKILTPPAWVLLEAYTCGEALMILDRNQIGVAICDTELQDGNWQELLAEFQTRAGAPNVIVSSPVADERLWAEVLNLGGYHLLPQPFDPDEVLRVTRMCWMAWRQSRTLARAAGQ